MRILSAVNHNRVTPEGGEDFREELKLRQKDGEDIETQTSQSSETPPLQLLLLDPEPLRPEGFSEAITSSVFKSCLFKRLRFDTTS